MTYRDALSGSVWPSRLIWIVLLLLAATDSAAQSTADTTAASRVRQRRPGFDLPDSLYIAADSIRGDVDTIVQYTAKDSIVFDIRNKRMTLTNEAVVNFQGRQLSAYTIVFDFVANTLTAYSADYDSVVSSSLSRRRRIIRDTSRVATRGAPILREGDTPYEGEVIIYNFKTRRGTVQLGTTEMEGGFYYGEKIKQVDRNTLFVQNGRFTTCDAPVPHYYFEAPKMKVIMKEQVFAAPVFLYIADVPIFGLPFGVFPNHSGGRRSGLIAPNYQTSGDRGYGLTHLGFYQVFSDYFDAAVRTDLYTKGGWNGEVLLQYMKRYILGGPVTLRGGYGMTRINSIDPYSKEWSFGAAMNNLNLGVNTTLSTNLDFRSNNYRRHNAQNIQDVIQQNANSHASFSTSWEDLGLSLGVNYSRSQDLINSTYSETSPSINLSKNQWFPFAPAVATGERTLLQTLGFSYGGNYQRSVRRDLINQEYLRREQYGILHSPRVTISPKLGYLNFTPFFDYSEAWFFRRSILHPILMNDSVAGVDEEVVNGFDRLHRYSAGVNLSTTLYGIANVGAFGVKAIRHTVLPNVSLSYSPDFSDQGIATYKDALTGREIRYNIFQQDLNAGSFSGGKSARINFGLGNDFEAKVSRQVTEDSSADEKVKLLNVSANSGYDFIQEKYSDLTISAFSRIGTVLNVSGNATYSPYPATVTGQDSVEHTLAALGHGLLRPKAVSFSLSGSLSSSESVDGFSVDSLRRLLELRTPDDERRMMLGGYFPGDYVYVPFRPRWNLSFGLSYTESYFLNRIERNFSGDANISLSLTTNWAFSTGARYDFVNKRMELPQITVHRDLHCWEMNFTYNPTGIIRGFNLEIRVKADQLRDLKLTRTDRAYGQF